MNPQEQTYAIMTPQTTAILEKIREVCPELRELSFGCEVKQKNTASDFYGRSGFLLQKPDARGIISIQYEEYPSCGGVLVDHEIIGHPVHLEHLLLVIPDNYIEIRLSKPFVLLVNHDNGTDVQYNLFLSLTQNLETNTELREWVYKLICEWSFKKVSDVRI